ncbi:serine hydrolase domain-containing protein [Moheibacter lacus]|uniref:Beta-lactamase family protein n=1 Tax=Moheibacter lacus TaxID=2745851 RepID=A0A838ZRB3_9FLAO|nr:serine hydrolase domain-containing protein [Moheibacter lacus]MBA5628773.1 beta-lactamase family protein [Moheibacter lacus]
MNLKSSISAFLFLAANLVFAQQNHYKETIDSVLHYFQENHAFSGRVTIEKNNEVLYDGDYNLFGKGKGNYKVGSVTKMFTAVLVFQLIEEEKLKLETPLSDFYPEIKNADEITIGNLLSHTSGLYEILGWDEYYLTRNQSFSKEQLLKLILNGKPEFKPNKDCSYSNSNYLLLGFILEDVTEKPYAELVKEKISDQIGLKNTYVAVSGGNQPTLDSYIFDGEDWVKDVSSDPSLPFAAGSIVSNNEDLIQFLKALFEGQLISQTSLDQMKTLKSKTIGHGLFNAPFYEKTAWGHTGRIDEFKTAAFYFPEEDLTLVITMDAGRVGINDIALPVLSKFYGKKYNYPEFYHSEITEPDFSVFEGDYKIKLAGIISVGIMRIKKAKNNFLFMTEVHDGKESEWVLLERMDENTFYSRRANAKLEFSFDKKNETDKITLEQGKFKISGVKID